MNRPALAPEIVQKDDTRMEGGCKSVGAVHEPSLLLGID
jgi:hypothetical protein